jgi:hypothetical protein
MIVTSSKKDGQIHVMKARYFKGGKIADMQKCYIAQIGEYYAHGETISQAVSDARFKQMQDTMDVESVVRTIKDAGHFTRETFRLLTGACSFGVEQFLKEHDLHDKDTLSISDTLRITKGAYGGSVVAEYFEHMEEAQ